MQGNNDVYFRLNWIFWTCDEILRYKANFRQRKFSLLLRLKPFKNSKNFLSNPIFWENKVPQWRYHIFRQRGQQSWCNGVCNHQKKKCKPTACLPLLISKLKSRLALFVTNEMRSKSHGHIQMLPRWCKPIKAVKIATKVRIKKSATRCKKTNKETENVTHAKYCIRIRITIRRGRTGCLIPA